MAAGEFRSTNGQLQWIIAEALHKSGRLKNLRIGNRHPKIKEWNIKNQRIMKLLNNIIQTFKTPIPAFDRVLEIAALFLLVLLLVLTTVLYQQAPEQIPTRFNSEDMPTNWDNKAVLWYMTVFFMVLMLLSAVSAYNIKLVNLPVRLKEPVAGIQKALVSRMSRYLTLSIGMSWLSYLVSVSTSIWNIKLFAFIFTKISLLLLLVPVIYYSVKIWWVGRRY